MCGHAFTFLQVLSPKLSGESTTTPKMLSLQSNSNAQHKFFSNEDLLRNSTEKRFEKRRQLALKEPHLPSDPRDWDRDEVRVWLRHMCLAHNLQLVEEDRFAMNGKALCLMTIEMFSQRVPLGGKLLYKDFQLRLAFAMHKEMQDAFKQSIN